MGIFISLLIKSFQEYARNLWDLSICPCFEASGAAKIIMLNRPGPFPFGNHEPTIEHLTGSLLCAISHPFATRMAGKISLRHLSLQSDLFFILFLECSVD
jgi:hypothetical protein